MTNIGIVTIIDYYNYGNRLQNYALSCILNRQPGCRAFTLEGYETDFFQGNVPGWLKEKLALQMCRFPKQAIKRWGPGFLRWYRFSEWSRRWIPRKRFYACQELPEKLNEQFDLFFSGSDQVWNCRIDKARLRDYFLLFAEKEKRNAISASFGMEQVPEEMKDFYTKALAEFSHLSVREEAGAEIVKELTGREAPVLADPVMMLDADEWMKVAERTGAVRSRPYVLKYFLGDRKESEVLNAWAEENGLEVYDLMDKERPDLYAGGPGEFLSFIHDADLICSDSFHCIAFSILFRRPFVVYARQGKEDYMTSRLDTLLSKFGFEGRWKHLLSEQEYLDCDFSGLERKLGRERSMFYAYINGILNSVNE